MVNVEGASMKEAWKFFAVKGFFVVNNICSLALTDRGQFSSEPRFVSI